MNIARVFPHKATKATPDDPFAFVNCEPPADLPAIDEVHISVAFTWTRKRAEDLKEAWSTVAPTRIGGPGYSHTPGAAFVPGMYLKQGYGITSRGCPNQCWFCSVWRREPGLVELPICECTNILDDNLLACSERHIREVFAMLKRQKRGLVEFTGGLEAKRLEAWHVHLLADLKPAQMFFALDTPDDEEPLRVAAKMLREAGFDRHRLRCYVLIGYPRDTIEQAESRLRLCVELGFYPMAMLWRDEYGTDHKTWSQLSREWIRPALIYAKTKSAAKLAVAGSTSYNTGMAAEAQIFDNDVCKYCSKTRPSEHIYCNGCMDLAQGDFSLFEGRKLRHA
jgi:hypothetical protein